MSGVKGSLVCAVAILAASGCCTLGEGDHRFHHRNDSGVIVPAETVDVGGEVASPGRLEIQEGGISLRRALALAGGIRQGGAGVAEESVAFDPARLSEIEELARKQGEARAIPDLVEFAMVQIPLSPEALATMIAAAGDAGTKADALIMADKDRPWFVDLEQIKTKYAALANCEERIKFKAHPELAVLVENQPMSKLEGDKTKLLNEIQVLKQKLIETRSTTFVGVKENSRAYLVALRRDAADGNTHYFPYESASAGLAGEIPLLPGDLVQVVHYAQSSLGAKRDATAGSGVIVQGFVENPGLKRIEGGFSRIKELQEKTNSLTKNDPNAVWTVSRLSPGGEQEVFVIPPDLAGSVMGDARLVGNDTLTLTSLPLVPIVTEGLLQRSLGGKRQFSSSEAKLRRDERHAGRVQRYEEKMADAGPLTAKLRKGLQEGRQSLGNRLGMGVR
jgi:hypothetical protein